MPIIIIEIKKTSLLFNNLELIYLCVVCDLKGFETCHDRCASPFFDFPNHWTLLKDAKTFALLNLLSNLHDKTISISENYS